MIRKILSFFRKLAVFAFTTPLLKKVRRKSPATYFLLAKRFNLRKFSGMPLTLLTLVLIGNLAMMLDTYEDILNTKEFIQTDNAVAEFLFGIRIDAVAKFFYIVTQLGNEFVILSGFIITTVYFIVRKKSHNIIGLLISVAGSALTVQIGKNIFKIKRPVMYSYYHMDSYSFPSGHSTVAVAFYGLIFYFLIRNAKKRNDKFALLISGLLLIVLIGFSRMYLCEHFLSDVLGGYLLGSLWLLLSISVLLWKEDKINSARR